MKTLLEGTLTHIPLKLIAESDEIGYRTLDKEHVKNLTGLIKDHGLDQPLIVWNGGGDKGVMVELENGTKVAASYLVAGRHRRHAIRAIFKQDPARYKELFPNGVPVIVRGGDLQEAILAQLRENAAREDATYEQVLPQAIRLRDEFKMKNRAIAKAIGKSESWVSQVFDVEEVLGADAGEELTKGNLKLSHARKAAQKVKAAKKAGTPIDAKAELNKVKAKAAATKAKGKKREDRRVSPSKVMDRYLAVRKTLKLGEKLVVLENALGYLAGNEEYELPEELSQPQGEDTKGTKAK